MTGNHLEYLTAFFNSKLFKFTFKDYFPELLGETRELRKVFFETIKVKPATNEDWYKNILEQIIISKNKGLSTLELERKIDVQIFDLYELTATERSIILGEPSEKPIKSISLVERE